MNWQSAYHAPVLAREVVDQLGNARHVLDGTLGGGGHAAALLERGVRVSAIDRDPAAVSEASTRLAPYIQSGQLRVRLGNYADLDLVDDLDGEMFDGILLDLGVSSHQLDDEGRGFTFRRGAPLDMRMGADSTATAGEWLNAAPRAELKRAFADYADEPRASRLAGEIERRRERTPFAISDDLVGAIRAVLGPSAGPADFARLFQGVRIAVNDELAGLAAALPALRDRLLPEGRFAVIAYHSGEDRLVKHAFQAWSRRCTCPPRQPVCTCGGQARGALVQRKPIVARDDEVAANPRARSAHLRVWRSAA
ncbi:MAG: 16S rRNA (cytosine(1402)-N(4))-methyltransferase RsmH [Gemmatimonadaceae bacterium]|nr:16S rRNA (cytosine(1402)-N(4))-methyltransferase RsmH [Gemmatimonadaceae bacterium]